MSIIIGKGNHATYREGDILENIEKQPICSMEPKILAKHKNIDYQVSKVNAVLDTSLPECLDVQLK